MRVLLVTLMSVLSTMALPIAAGAVQMDGKLPIYPNSTMPDIHGTQPPSVAYAYGITLLLQTPDAPATVSAWYRAHLPSAYTVETRSTSSHFVGPGGIVNVVVFRGHTRIAVVPNH